MYDRFIHKAPFGRLTTPMTRSETVRIGRGVKDGAASPQGGLFLCREAGLFTLCLFSPPRARCQQPLMPVS